MDKQQAQNIVRETFENPFDKGRFVAFVKNLLNSIEDAPFSYKGNFIPDAYEQYISSLERIGKYTAGDHKIDILVVKLKKKTSIERARTMQRNFIAWYLNGSRGGEMKDAALAAFVSPDGDDWRFSLVKMDYRFEEGKSGKVKIKEEFTPARRWSFLVGENESSHTVQSKLYPIIANDEHNPTLAELEYAFNIEKVTKEFFEKYRDLFLWTKEMLDEVVAGDASIKADFKAKGVNTVDFAKKLLGQIVFLYFLQKKGWFGVARDADWGTGSKRFLRELFEGRHGAYNNFFNDILESLFYDALRNDRSHDDGYYSRFNCKIPFLNGGLFDPIGNKGGYDWVHTDIHLPDSLFSNKNKTKEGDDGDGILDIFDRYNFTVKEDEPMEKEVAIDPELLGKAYEKFNAIRPDNFEEYKKALKNGQKGTENKFNKQYGVYYTPREIVHYMCQQSLINYLYTTLNDAPVSYEKLGEEQTVIFKDTGKKPQLDLTIEHRPCPVISKEDIETLIKYGEQLGENEATAIIKAQKISEGKQQSTKIKSLLPESIRSNTKPIDEKLANIKVCDPAIGSGAFPVGMMSEIVKVRMFLNSYLCHSCESGNPEGVSRTPYNFKRECIEKSLYGVDIDPGAVEIAKLRLWLSLVVDEDDIKQIKPLPNLDYKIVCGNSLLGVEKNLFNDALFKELERLKHLLFDETNPTKKQEYKNQIDDLISKITDGHKEFDFEVYFSEVFHEKGGFDVVIANPPWGSKLSADEKQKLKENYPEIDSSTPNSFAYFLGLSKKTARGTIAYVLPDSILIKDYAKTRKLIEPTLSVLKWFQNIGMPDNLKPFENVEHDVCLLILDSGITDKLLCSTTFYNTKNKSLEIKEWIANKDEMIFEQFDYAYNLLISKRDLTILKKINQFKPIYNYLQCHEGIHTGNSRELLFKEKKENKFCKPLFYGGGAGDEINNYVSMRYGWYVDYRLELFDKKDGYYASLRDERIFISPKIYITRTGNPFKAFLDKDTYASNNFFSLQFLDYKKNSIESLKAILPFIISKLSQYFIRTFAAPRLGNTFVETKIIHLLKFKIPELSDKQRNQIIILVDKILSAKQKDPNADTSALEKQIDEMVYALYGLTPEEIEIVEGKE